MDLIRQIDKWTCQLNTLLNLSAKVVVELAKSRLIQAAVLLHPSFITLDDIKGKKFYMYIYVMYLLTLLNKFMNQDFSSSTS